MLALEEIVEAEETISDNGLGDDELLEGIDFEGIDLSAEGLYFAQANHSLLSAEEELDLIIKYQDNLKYVEDVEKGKIELNEDALDKAKKDRDQANEKLHRYNQRLIISIAKQYLGRGSPFTDLIDLMDLIQEGNIGLSRALKKFDRKRGYRLSTYASWWIRQAITRALAEEGGAVRFPVHVGVASYKIHRAIEKYEGERGKEPPTDDLVEITGYTPNTVKAVRRCMYPVSLDEPVGEDEDATRGEFVEDPNIKPHIDYASKNELKNDLEGLLQSLTPRERKVIKLRFGLVGGYSMTLEEVGKIMGYTRENIRLIQKKALRKLRHPSRSRVLIDYLA